MAATLRVTKLKNIFPFDEAVNLHKWWAIWGVFATVVHIVGHTFNFISIASQPEDDLFCVFREVYVSTNIDRSMTWWVFKTATGLSGVLLTIVLILISVLASTPVREGAFWLFWLSHKMLWWIFFGTSSHSLRHLLC